MLSVSQANVCNRIRFMTLTYAYGFVLGISGMQSRMTLRYAIVFVDNQVM